MKITFGEMRGMSLHGVLVYCHCGHHVAVDADRWPDEMRLSIPSRDLFAKAADIGRRRSA
jgi:hypothetical protein